MSVMNNTKLMWMSCPDSLVRYRAFFLVYRTHFLMLLCVFSNASKCFFQIAKRENIILCHIQNDSGIDYSLVHLNELLMFDELVSICYSSLTHFDSIL